MQPDYDGAVASPVLDILIEAGADINARDKYKLTALHHAAIRGNVSAIEKLFENPLTEREVKDSYCKHKHLHFYCLYFL